MNLTKAIPKGFLNAKKEDLPKLYKFLQSRIGPPTLMRHEKNPERLALEGFNPDRQAHPYGTSIGGWGEPNGLYYAPSGGKDQIKSMQRLISGPHEVSHAKPNVKGYVLPGAREKIFDNAEWNKVITNQSGTHRSAKDLTDELKEKYDVIHFPDAAVGQDELLQSAQLNPQSVMAKIKTDKGYAYKVIGAAGLGTMGLLAGDALSPKDAEAAGFGKQIKGVWDLFKTAMRSKTRLGNDMRKAGQINPALSSAHKDLVGKVVKGSKISGVYQGQGDHRYVHLEDGRIFPTDRDGVHELAAELGTQDYIQKFGQAEGGAIPGGGAKWDQIFKSYRLNQQWGTPSRSGGRKPDRIRILEDSLTTRQGMLGKDNIADQVLVQDTETKMWWLWPRVYAEPAEAAGLVKIDRAKNTLFTNKGLYNGQSR